MSEELTTLDERIENVLLSRFESIGIDKKTVLIEMSFAAQLLQRNVKLKNCPAESIINAILNAVQCGLTLSPILKEAYLVPRSGLCCLDPSYVGLAKTVTDTGAVTSINCQVVYKGDDYIIDLATEKIVQRHTPAYLVGKQRGPAIACYSIATLATGELHCEIVPVDGAGGIFDTSRRRSESWKYYERAIAEGKTATCVWVTDEEQMIRKSTIKRHTSKLPRSTGDWSKVNQLVETDNQDYSLEAGQQQVGRLWTLIQAVETIVTVHGEPKDYKHECSEVADRIGQGITIDEAETVAGDLTGLLVSHYKEQLELTGHKIGSTFIRDGKPIKIKGLSIYGSIKAVYLDDEGNEQKKPASVNLKELYESNGSD